MTFLLSGIVHTGVLVYLQCMCVHRFTTSKQLVITMEICYTGHSNDIHNYGFYSLWFMLLQLNHTTSKSYVNH